MLNSLLIRTDWHSAPTRWPVLSRAKWQQLANYLPSDLRLLDALDWMYVSTNAIRLNDPGGKRSHPHDSLTQAGELIGSECWHSMPLWSTKSCVKKAEQIKRNNHSDCTPLAPIRVRALPRFWAQPIDWWIGVCLCVAFHENWHTWWGMVSTLSFGQNTLPVVDTCGHTFSEPVYFYLAFFAWEWQRLLIQMDWRWIEVVFNGESASPRRMVSLCFYWQEREEWFFFLFLRRINVWWC